MALAIVAAAAFILGAVYEALAYTEEIMLYNDGGAGYLPNYGGINVTNNYWYTQQSFTTSATTTNISSVEFEARKKLTKCGADTDVVLALCSGATPGSDYLLADNEFAGYTFPCNGATPVYGPTIFTATDMATTTWGWWKADTRNDFLPVHVSPNTQYYWDIKTYHIDTDPGDDSCITMTWGNGSTISDGQMYGSATVDLSMKIYKATDYEAASTTHDIHVWELEDLESLKASTSKVIVPEYNVCYYDDASPCDIEVYWNDAATEAGGVIMLSKYIYGGGAIDYLDYHSISATDDGHAYLSYSPKENTATTVPICVTHAWYEDGQSNYTEDCKAKVHWKSRATLDDQYAQLFGYADCDCDNIAATTTAEGGWTWITDPLDNAWAGMRYGIECGGRKLGCFFFIPSATSTMRFESARNTLLNGFPFSMVTAVREEIMLAYMKEHGALEVPIYIWGYPAASTSTLLGTFDVLELDDKLDQMGWPYVYLIMKYMIWIGFFGLIIWRLWHIVTGEHYEEEEEHVDQTLVPQDNSKKRYATKGQVPVVNLRK